MKWKVMLSDIDFSPREIQAVMEVLKSGWLTQGEVTASFERQFAKFVGVKHALAVSNGTAALHLALLACGVGEGDEVLVPSLTFVATVNSILYCRAKPVFVDLESLENLNISQADLEKKFTEKTKAVMLVHYGGYPIDMPRVVEIVKRAEAKYARRISIIEDAAHAPGAEIAGKKCGSWSEVGCFSFFANKNIATGEGGMVVTDSDEQAAKLKLLRSHGMTSLSWDRFKGHSHGYDVVDLGYNYRMTEIESALGREQLKKLNHFNAERKRLTGLYRKELAKVEEILLPFANYKGKPSYHLFPVILSDRIRRVDFMERLKKDRIQTSVHYPPAHKFSYIKKRLENGAILPITEIAGERQVTLPLHSKMTEADVKFIARAVRKAVAGKK